MPAILLQAIEYALCEIVHKINFVIETNMKGDNSDEAYHEFTMNTSHLCGLNHMSNIIPNFEWIFNPNKNNHMLNSKQKMERKKGKRTISDCDVAIQIVHFYQSLINASY